ncbi:hypothetical protein LB504_009956 [Fusarium proliferatum]|nr:hypothetical protein LB504_009956 [Fusarium proliferatum]
MSFSIISNVPTILVSLHGLAHVECVLARPGRVRCVVTVVVLHHAEDAVTQILVKGNGSVVAASNEQVHEPGVLSISCNFQLISQDLCNARSSSFRGNSERRYMSVPCINKLVLNVNGESHYIQQCFHPYPHKLEREMAILHGIGGRSLARKNSCTKLEFVCLQQNK